MVWLTTRADRLVREFEIRAQIDLFCVLDDENIFRGRRLEKPARRQGRAIRDINVATGSSSAIVHQLKGIQRQRSSISHNDASAIVIAEICLIMARHRKASIASIDG